MVVESEPNLDEGLVDFLAKFEIVSIIVFTIEYLIRTGEIKKMHTPQNNEKNSYSELQFYGY